MHIDHEPERRGQEWEEVLKIEPNHKQSKEAIEKAKKKIKRTAKKR